MRSPGPRWGRRQSLARLSGKPTLSVAPQATVLVPLEQRGWVRPTPGPGDRELDNTGVCAQGPSPGRDDSPQSSRHRPLPALGAGRGPSPASL